MQPAYQPTLVLLSLLVATAAAYVALDLTGRIAAAHGAAHRWWLGGGALAMGIGIWSMHFVGMLAFRLRTAGGAPVPIAYDVPRMLVSVLVAVLAAGVALAVIGRHGAVGAGARGSAGLVMGAAICGMHYIGMASMRLPAAMAYRPTLVAASVAIAVLASVFGLGVAFRLRDEQGGVPVARRLGGAVVLGLAIAGMHYTAMAAATFAPRPAGSLALPAGAVLATDGLAGVVVAGTLVVLALALLGTALDRRLRARLRQAAEHERLWRAAEEARAHAEAARAEAERLRAEAEAANRAKSGFLSTMSHELRTPLNAIAGYVQLLEMELRGPVTAAQREDLARIGRAQRRLLALVNDLLDLARIEGRAVALRRAPVPLEPVVDEVLAVLAAQLELKALTVEHAGAACEAVACGDRERIAQILLNLVGNGIKFTRPGGRIAVRCAVEGDAALVRVTDTGVGIPAEKLEAVFEPFVQLSTGLTRQAEGTGLGLAISRDLARAMGGDVTVESAPEAGATFTLRMPAVVVDGARDGSGWGG